MQLREVSGPSPLRVFVGNQESAKMAQVIQEVISLLSAMNIGLSQDYQNLSRELREFKVQVANEYLPADTRIERVSRKELCMKSISDILVYLQFYDAAAQKLDHQIHILIFLQDEVDSTEIIEKKPTAQQMMPILPQIMRLCIGQLLQIRKDYQDVLFQIENTLSFFPRKVVPQDFDFSNYIRHLRWFEQLSLEAILLLEQLCGKEEEELSTQTDLSYLFNFYTTQSERDVHFQLFPNSHPLYQEPQTEEDPQQANPEENIELF